jgi:predicted peptidase
MRLIQRVMFTAAALCLATSLFAQAAAPAAPQTSTATATPAAPGARRGVLSVLDELPTAASHARIQTRSYNFSQAGRSMDYELFVPKSYNPSRPTPLVVALHCLGAVARDMIRYEGLTEEAEKRGYIVVAPMGYNERGWYGSRGAGQTGRGPNPADPANLGELSELDVMNVIEIVRKDFNVDPNRMYLMGHSMGGGGTMYIGTKHPEMWAAFGLAAPALQGSPDQMSAIAKKPIIVVQGDQDTLVNVEGTRRWIAKMKELGMKHTYIEVAGGDHMLVAARNPDYMRQLFDLFDASRR